MHFNQTDKNLKFRYCGISNFVQLILITKIFKLKFRRHNKDQQIHNRQCDRNKIPSSWSKCNSKSLEEQCR